MCKNNRGKHRLFQINLQPGQFFRRDIRIGPFEVLATIRGAIAFETGVQHDKMIAVPIE